VSRVEDIGEMLVISDIVGRGEGGGLTDECLIDGNRQSLSGANIFGDGQPEEAGRPSILSCICVSSTDIKSVRR
jgi:hypothetical protein